MENKIKSFKDEKMNREYKESSTFLKYIESLNGDYRQYINNIREDDIDILYKTCQIFFWGGCNQRKN